MSHNRSFHILLLILAPSHPYFFFFLTHFLFFHRSALLFPFKKQSTFNQIWEVILKLLIQLLLRT